ncbi:MAG: hypothetical protein V4629_14130 [Pseudomonadota bacterium]
MTIQTDSLDKKSLEVDLVSDEWIDKPVRPTPAQQLKIRRSIENLLEERKLRSQVDYLVYDKDLLIDDAT